MRGLSSFIICRIFLVVIVLLSGVYVSVQSPKISVAHAHGKSMNLTKYCKDTYEKGVWPLPWSAKFRQDQEDSGIWECIEEKRQGFNTMMGGTIKAIDPAKACQVQHGTSLIHFHEGDNMAKSSDMHCGYLRGTVPIRRHPDKTVDRRHAVFKVCNQTSAEKIAVGYAYRDYRSAILQSRGWWPVEKGNCFELPLPAAGPNSEPYRGEAYLFGYHSKALLKGNGTDICIKRGPNFTVNNARDPQLCKLSDKQNMMDAFKFNLGGGPTEHIYKD